MSAAACIKVIICSDNLAATAKNASALAEGQLRGTLAEDVTDTQWERAAEVMDLAGKKVLDILTSVQGRP